MTKDTGQKTGLEKRCNACGVIKPYSDFNFRYDKSLPIPRPECRECQRARTQKWRQSEGGRAKILAYEADETKQAQIKANRKLPDRLANDAARHKRWRDTPEGRRKLAEIAKRTHQKPETKAKRSERRKVRYRSEPLYAADVAARSMLGRVLKKASIQKTDTTFAMLGYTAEQFRQRIECQFLPGMSWENRSHSTWHIDHRKPIAAFLAQGITNPKIINALSNLRPMWAADNMAKGAKWKSLEEGLRVAA